MRCHCGRASNQLDYGIAKSCNSYFANTYRKTIEKFPSSKEGMDVWHHMLKVLDLEIFLGMIFQPGRPGKIPNSRFI